MLPPPLAAYARIYVLHLNLRGAGFGAMLLQTINQIRYCERRGYLPVVNYDAACGSHTFDPARGDNMWEQYFAPLVDGLSYRQIQAWCADPNHPLQPSDLLTLPSEEMLHLCEHDADSVYSFTFADWRTRLPDDLPAWYAEQRRKGADIVGRYFRVRPEIVAHVDAFANRFMAGRPVLGLHIRGTDMMYAPPVAPAEYFPHVDRWLSERPGARLFVATDQAQYLETFQARYGAQVISSGSLRSTDAVAPFNKPEIDPHRRGEDVLIDILLLARCDFLLKGASNVGEMPMYFNPALRCEDLSLGKRQAFGQDYGAAWNGPLPEQTVPAWDLIRRRSLDRIPADASSQSRGQRFVYRFRPWWTWLPKGWRRGQRFFRRVTGLGRPPARSVR